jgi:hypothetical protein
MEPEIEDQNCCDLQSIIGPVKIFWTKVEPKFVNVGDVKLFNSAPDHYTMVVAR